MCISFIFFFLYPEIANPEPHFIKNSPYKNIHYMFWVFFLLPDKDNRRPYRSAPIKYSGQ
ncbi:MAG: hypothetical protein A2270_02855 [Elusimicrobia bacterium RIFOXYA12_FULL_51_18]|nr:MAG: hypothetical protein A2270_02855 [Elusimicrobia bacterium RIFOXYA12_FULL_51_18]OGS29236.1 MAG: hypothetical protein A2218_04700 [Elusimicrobia bacterium RIFOXYA2_FULL_53_38]